jgi:Ca2+-transporting ATPase
MVILLITTAELLRAHTSRSQRVSLYTMGFFSNPFMHASTGVALVLTYLLALTPFGQKIFQLEYLDGFAYALIIAVSLIPACADEVFKAFLRATRFGEPSTPKQFGGNNNSNSIAITVAPI